MPKCPDPIDCPLPPTCPTLTPCTTPLGSPGQDGLYGRKYRPFTDQNVPAPTKTLQDRPKLSRTDQNVPAETKNAPAETKNGKGPSKKYVILGYDEHPQGHTRVTPCYMWIGALVCLGAMTILASLMGCVCHCRVS